MNSYMNERSTATAYSDIALRAAARMSRVIHHCSITVDDLRAVAEVAVWEASLTHDPSRGALGPHLRFHAWKAVKAHVSDFGGPVRVPLPSRERHNLSVFGGYLDEPDPTTGDPRVSREHAPHTDPEPNIEAEQVLDLIDAPAAVRTQFRMRSEGYTLEEIGRRFGRSRQAVEQRLRTYTQRARDLQLLTGVGLDRGF